MEGNRDEAEKCVEIAREALNAGNREKAQRFLQKAEKLYPLPSARGEALGPLLPRPVPGPPRSPPPPHHRPSGSRGAPGTHDPARPAPGRSSPTHPRPGPDRPSRARCGTARDSLRASLPARCRLSAGRRELPVPRSVFVNVQLSFFQEIRLVLSYQSEALYLGVWVCGPLPPHLHPQIR